MADLADPATSLVDVINAMISWPARVYPGWPDPSLLQTDLKADFSNVTVWAMPSEKVTSVTMDDMDWCEESNDGLVGSLSREIRRQTRQYRISVWVSSPTARDALASQIDSGLAALSRITLADNSTGILSYVSSSQIDERQIVNIYRRDLVYSVNYATAQTQSATPIRENIINIT